MATSTSSSSPKPRCGRTPYGPIRDSLRPSLRRSNGSPQGWVSARWMRSPAALPRWRRPGVGMKRLLNHGVDVSEFGVEVEDVLSQTSDHSGRYVLSCDHGALSICGRDGAGCKVAGVVGVAVASPFLKACCADSAQCVRRLITGQQNQ